MSEFIKNTRIAHENSAARERGESIAREYERVVNTFNRVLVCKEKVRLTLENHVIDLQDQVNGNTEKLSTLNRNVEIYDTNVGKIATNLEEMLTEESRIKDKYNRLLRGASMEVVGVNVEDDALSGASSSEDETSTENLMQKRNHYLDGLSSSFHKLDDELQSISCLRTEMLNARSEIFKKKEQALEKKARFEENERYLKGELNKVKDDLEISVKEEEVLTLEYAQLLHKVENCIIISDDIDQVLFSSLTVANEIIK